MTFLTPLAGLVALAAVLPLAAALFGRTRADGVRRALGLEAAPARAGLLRPALAAAGIVLLGLAAAQPVLEHRSSQRVRKDVEALFVLDTSRSMAASATATSPTRLDRAIAAAARLRSSIPQVPSGVATLTDRVLPDLLPVAGVDSFDAVVRRAVAIESPPPQDSNVRATTYDTLAQIASGNYFDRTASRRIVVLLTDGESNPIDAGQIARDLPAAKGYRFVSVRFWGERRVRFRQQRQAGGRLPAGPVGRRAARRARRCDGRQGVSRKPARRRVVGAGAGRGKRTDGGHRGRDAEPLRARALPRRGRDPAPARRYRLVPCTGWFPDRKIDAAMIRGGLWWAGALIVAALASGVVGGGAAARNTVADVGWGGFGNTPDENRHSPLTQVDVGNVSKLGRLFTVDFRQIDPTVRRGEQSYPVEANGTLYVTTNDDNVWALDATTGKVKWRWTPGDVAVFRNFGIVANRGVALCDGHVFVLTLDMTIVSLNPTTGQLQRQVPIAKAVPGASSNYGYSETSAPICADHRVIVGAAGSEYGVRGFVMAYHTDLTPAWPNPFWTIPPAGTSWRKYGTLVGGGVVWTPTTVDPTTNTLYFGTGSATPLYFPQIRPGSNPRADSLIAVESRHGTDEVVAAADGAQRMVVRHRAAAARVHGEGRRQEGADRLGGDDGGCLVRVRRGQRPPDLPADQGDRPHRASGAPAREAGGGLPRVDRRAELLARLLRPAHELRLQRGRRDGGAGHAGSADPDREEAQVQPRRRVPRAGERQLRHAAPRLARPRLGQRDRRQHGQARLEVQHPGAGAGRRHHHR